jgi:MFS superfamily sulfate permease-like transporter
MESSVSNATSSGATTGQIEAKPAGSTGIFERIFGGNAYNRAEFAGAFGDLGTFIPFVVAYITINKIDPVGILVAFGLFKIYVGLLFKTPMPVQPMKAIGASAIANPAGITHGMIWGSGIFTAVFWTIMGLTGAVDWLAKITTKPIMRGIMLGLGISFAIEGLGMMRDNSIPWMQDIGLPLAILGLVVTFILLSSQRIPAMLLLLAIGIGSSFIIDPSLTSQLGQVQLGFRLPEPTWGKISWNDLLLGSLILGIPQAPLTLGNAILGVVGENNQLFPNRKTTAKWVALDHGLMNFVSAAIGGIPMCHGAGGLAGHVRFGARTGGALVILGVIVLFLGLFMSDSVALLFGMIPKAILGVILFFTGLELASTIRDIGSRKEDVYVMLVTAGIAIVNMGVGFVAGVVLFYALHRGWVKV